MIRASNLTPGDLEDYEEKRIQAIIARHNSPYSIAVELDEALTLLHEYAGEVGRLKNRALLLIRSLESGDSEDIADDLEKLKKLIGYQEKKQ